MERPRKPDELSPFMEAAIREGRTMTAPDLECLKKAKAGDRACIDRIVRFNMRIVRKVAGRYKKYAAYDDLVQEGAFGVVLAIQKFDLDKPNKFLTYAMWWIRAAVARAAHKNSGYRYTGSSLIKVGTAAPEMVSLDQKIWEDGETTIGDQIASDEPPIDDVKMRQQLLDEVRAVMLSVCHSPRERSVMERFCTKGDSIGDRVTLEQIGDEHGCTRERIRQIETKVKKKARENPKLRALEAALRGPQ